MEDDAEAELWVVAGCLFEVSLPAAERWGWAGPADEVTLLGDDVRRSGHHFRFRAEAARADAVTLAFHRDDGRQRSVPVRIAPESAPPH